MVDTYTCAMCGGTFEKGWSDEDAAAELEANCPGMPREACAIICDDCFNGRLGGAQEIVLGRDEHGVFSQVMVDALADALADVTVRKIVLDLGPRGDVPGSYALHDEIARIEIRARAGEQRRPDYLRHDPTKSMRRRRR
jgi:hypothetical protein